MVYNSKTYIFNAPHNGVYFVYKNVCLEDYKKTVMELLLNGTVAMNFAYLSPSHNSYDQRSRGLLLRLKFNDELRVRYDQQRLQLLQ